MAHVDEIAPDVFRISVFAPSFGISFNQFLVRDDQPLLFHAGMLAMFPEIRDGVAQLIDPASLRYVGFSHFESDECGAMNRWLDLAPQAQPLCGLVGALVNMNDFALRPAHMLDEGAVLSTGKRCYRLLRTPHLPHGWDSCLLFEETERTLFCSDLLLQPGETAALSSASIIGPARVAMVEGEAGPFAHGTPFTGRTGAMIEMLAQQAPRTIATMHGASYAGDGAQVLRDLAVAMKEVLAPD